MKKTVLISIAAIVMCMPAMADNEQPNIAVGTNPASCTESVLETTSGTSNLQAAWTPNTLNLQWIAPDAEGWSTQNGTCTYDGGITVPQTNPSKTGYTFAGWQVKASGFNLSSLFGPNSNSICDNGTDIGYAGKSETNDQNVDTYGLVQGSGDWVVEFSYGKIKGESRCSTQGVTNPWYNNGNVFASDHYASNITDETNTEGAQYCWCKPTLYAESNSNSYQTIAASSWVFYFGNGSAAYCAGSCALNCASSVQISAAIRGALFGVDGAESCQ